MCKRIGLKLLCLPTHFLNNQGNWVSVAEDEVDPIFELANKYGLAIQIHPYDGEKMIALKKQVLEVSFGLDDGSMCRHSSCIYTKKPS